MANKDLFKQAIADAKSVREAAIANAKAALEESLTPQLKELLAQRLAEMEETEEEVIAEEEVSVEETIEETTEEVVAEEEGEEAEEEAEGDSEESEDEAEEDAEGEEPAGEEEIADSDMTVDDLKDLIRDILSQEMGNMEGEEGDMEGDMEADAEGEDMAAMDMTAADDEEINLEELMAELAEMAKDEVITEEEAAEETVEEEVVAEEETVEEGAFDKIKQLVAKMQQNAKEGKPLIDDEFFAFADKMNVLDPGTVSGGFGHQAKVMQRPEKQNEDLNEALETIETLRKEINETNLLNAKLLYVNKVFKANNLSEAQKANVIAAFDKAETVKEVKLVFETVSENIPSGVKKEVVREAKGFASAAVGISDKPEVITEANSAVLRMQKLAGIIK